MIILACFGCISFPTPGESTSTIQLSFQFTENDMCANNLITIITISTQSACLSFIWHCLHVLTPGGSSALSDGIGRKGDLRKPWYLYIGTVYFLFFYLFPASTAGDAAIIDGEYLSEESLRCELNSGLHLLESARVSTISEVSHCIYTRIFWMLGKFLGFYSLASLLPTKIGCRILFHI